MIDCEGPIDGPIVVGSYSSESEAYWAQRCLVEEGIESFVAFEHHHSLNPLMRIALGGVRVTVELGDAAHARELLAAYDAETYAKYKSLNRVCPSCGSSDILLPRVPYILFLVFLVLTVGLLALLFRRSRRCRACGQMW